MNRSKNTDDRIVEIIKDNTNMKIMFEELNSIIFDLIAEKKPENK